MGVAALGRGALFRALTAPGLRAEVEAVGSAGIYDGPEDVEARFDGYLGRRLSIPFKPL